MLLLWPALSRPILWLAVPSAPRPMGSKLTITFSASPLPGFESVSL